MRRLRPKEIALSRRVLLVVAVVLVAALAGVLFLNRRDTEVVWQGYAEADYVKVGPVQPGLLTEVLVGRGAEVSRQTLLFVQDETADKAARDQAARQLDQAKAALANLEAGGKATEIQQAEANLAAARAQATRASADLKRAQDLLRDGYSTQQDVDQLAAAARSADANVRATTAAVAQLIAPLGRATEIAAQRQAVEAASAALDIAQWRLDQRRVLAPTAARVADVLARPGETMQAGAPVVSLLPPENIFVRFFVPEAALSSIHRGDTVALRCDGCPQGLSAVISFVSPTAEYTPPVIYSESSRAKLVYLIEARPKPEQAALLNPGQPMDVRPLAKKAP
jgi:HlyD family secretion protein